MEFQLPTDEECQIVVKDSNGNALCTLDCLDVVIIRQQAIEEAEKLGLDDFWDLVLDKLASKFNLDIKHKSSALALYAQANDMLVDIKKKSYLLPSPLDSSDSPQDGDQDS
jgi:hypothetical protein